MKIGAPGSIARHVQDRLDRDPQAFGENMWLVYEYEPGKPEPTLRAAQSTRTGAEAYMAEGRVLVNLAAYCRHAS